MAQTRYGPRTITTMRIPDELLAAMDEAASIAKLPRTEWLIKLLYEHLGPVKQPANDPAPISADSVFG